MACNSTKTKTFLDTIHLNRSVAAAVSRSKIQPRLEFYGQEIIKFRNCSKLSIMFVLSTCRRGLFLLLIISPFSFSSTFSNISWEENYIFFYMLKLQLAGNMKMVHGLLQSIWCQQFQKTSLPVLMDFNGNLMGIWGSS